MRTEHHLIINILKKHKYSVLGTLLFDVLATIIALAIPILVKLQIDQLENQNDSFFGVLQSSPLMIFVLIVGLVALINFLERGLRLIGNLIRTKTRYKIAMEVEKTLYQKLETFDAGFLDNPRNKRIVASIFDITFLANEVVDFVVSQITTVITIFGILPIMAFIDWQIFVLITIVSIIQGIILRIRLRKENTYRVLEERIYSKYWQFRSNLNHNFQNILVAGGEEKIFDDYWTLQDKRNKLEVQKQKFNLSFSLIEWLNENIAQTGAALFAGFKVLMGATSIGSFTMITLYAGRLQTAFLDIFSVVQRWHQMDLTFDRIGFFMTLEPRFDLSKIKDHKLSHPKQIVFQKLSFTYPSLSEGEKKYIQQLIQKTENIHKNIRIWNWDKQELEEWKSLLEEDNDKNTPVLRDINCTFQQGDITALVGRNGSGKTTLTHMILRNYDTTQGAVLVDTISTKEMLPKKIKKMISIIHQTPFVLYNFTIKENILLGVQEEVSETEIWKLLERLEIKKDIEKLPKKLESILGDDINLSGGQLQLLVLARVFLQKRPIVIFDEGTNQLDAEHELKILNLLQEIKKDAIVILITHRMTTARKADHIYVIDDGKIVQSGDHTSILKEEKGLYKKFWNLQVLE